MSENFSRRSLIQGEKEVRGGGGTSRSMKIPRDSFLGEIQKALISKGGRKNRILQLKVLKSSKT